ncbi:hypothetical protein ACFVFS_23955 [Kitasatospora sp. NPDC057692]|uniref:hypothetical protein n=1 Tax=Kitasatospora sp. NPDC057692 TaxID=3346215 RepID=UPI003695A49A
MFRHAQPVGQDGCGECDVGDLFLPWPSDYGSNANDLLWTLELVVDHSVAAS